MPFPPEKSLMSLGVDGLVVAQAQPLFRRQLDGDLSGHLSGDLVLKPDDVAEITLVASRPEVSFGVGIDELRRHPNVIAVAHHGTLQDRIDVQDLRDLRKRLFRIPELHDRLPRYDPQRADLGEVADQGVRHPIGEVLVSAIARQIRQGEDGDRLDPRARPRSP